MDAAARKHPDLQLLLPLGTFAAPQGFAGSSHSQPDIGRSTPDRTSHRPGSTTTKDRSTPIPTTDNPSPSPSRNGSHSSYSGSRRFENVHESRGREIRCEE